MLFFKDRFTKSCANQRNTTAGIKDCQHIHLTVGTVKGDDAKCCFDQFGTLYAAERAWSRPWKRRAVICDCQFPNLWVNRKSPQQWPVTWYQAKQWRCPLSRGVKSQITPFNKDKRRAIEATRANHASTSTPKTNQALVGSSSPSELITDC